MLSLPASYYSCCCTQIEAVGMISPRDIVRKSIGVLREKCGSFLEVFDEVEQQFTSGAENQNNQADGDDIEAMLE